MTLAKEAISKGTSWSSLNQSCLQHDSGDSRPMRDLCAQKWLNSDSGSTAGLTKLSIDGCERCKSSGKSKGEVALRARVSVFFLEC